MWQDCVAGDLSSGISFRSAGTHILLISLPPRDVSASNVSLRSHADNFLSFGRDKETLTRTGSLIYHLVQPVSEVRRERRRGQFLTLFPRSFRR